MTLIIMLLLLLTTSAQARYYVPLPRAHIVHAECPEPILSNEIACTYQATSTIYVSARCDDFCIAHEYGHIFDAQEMTDSARTKWSILIGKSFDRWHWDIDPDGRVVDPLAVPGEENFADAYALCAIGKERREDFFSSPLIQGLFIGPKLYEPLPRPAVALACWLATHR